MKLFKKTLAIFLCIGVFMTVIPVWAEETTAEQEGVSAKYAKNMVQSVANHLAIYARYEDVTVRNLYQSIINGLVDEDPQIYEKVLKLMLESIDEHSEYYNPEEAKEITENITGEITGIGITIDFNNGSKATIASVIPDTPADRAGLQVNDVLLRADGTELTDLKSEMILRLIRGEAGTTVVVDVDRAGAVLSFEMVREEIVGTSITHEIYGEGSDRAMYIRIHGFVKNTAEKFREALDVADKEKITNLILDLRNNGGGILEQAILMAENFVPEDKIITTQDHKTSLFNVEYKGKVTSKEKKYDIALLMNQYSASASEVFAAALRENDLAKIIGTNSYGKGTIQSLTGLNNGGMIKFTAGFYLTPNGNNINGIGLVPDAIVINTFDSVEPDKFGTFAYDRIYQEGDTGEAVLIAKKILSFMNIYRGEINDVYDRDLYYAVSAFQTRAKLFPYGVLDLTTQMQLRNFLGDTKVEQDDQLEAALAYFGLEMPEKEE